jgi:hypothetical protein
VSDPCERAVVRHIASRKENEDQSIERLHIYQASVGPEEERFANLPVILPCWRRVEEERFANLPAKFTRLALELRRGVLQIYQASVGVDEGPSLCHCMFLTPQHVRSSRLPCRRASKSTRADGSARCAAGWHGCCAVGWHVCVMHSYVRRKHEPYLACIHICSTVLPLEYKTASAVHLWSCCGSNQLKLLN